MPALPASVPISEYQIPKLKKKKEEIKRIVSE
jgi:hypothetical protein